MSIKVDYEKCCWKDGSCSGSSCTKDCTGCAEACPTEAIIRAQTLMIDDSQCINCGMCVKACPNNALSLE